MPDINLVACCIVNAHDEVGGGVWFCSDVRDIAHKKDNAKKDRICLTTSLLVLKSKSRREFEGGFGKFFNGSFLKDRFEITFNNTPLGIKVR